MTWPFPIFPSSTLAVYSFVFYAFSYSKRLLLLSMRYSSPPFAQAVHPTWNSSSSFLVALLTLQVSANSHFVWKAFMNLPSAPDPTR